MLVKWAIGKDKNKAQNPNRQNDSKILWVNPDHLQAHINPEDKVIHSSTKNHLGDRMDKAIAHWSKGGHMDPPDISFRKHDTKYPIGIENGRHRVAAATKLGEKLIPINVHVSDINKVKGILHSLKEETVSKLSLKDRPKTFEDKLTAEYFNPDELHKVRDVAYGISKGAKTYNRHIRETGKLPNENSYTDKDSSRISRGINLLFSKKKNINLEKSAVLYHGTRHEINFHHDDNNGYVTKIRGIVSMTPKLGLAKTHANKETETIKDSKEKGIAGDRNFHHVLAIHYDPEKHNHIPHVNIAHWSGTSEDEIIAPPATKYKLLKRQPEHGGFDEKTGKEILIHHVEPIETHTDFDKKFSDLSKEEKQKRLADQNL